MTRTTRRSFVIATSGIATAGTLQFAVASGVLGLIVTALAGGFLVATYLLMRGRSRPSDR